MENLRILTELKEPYGAMNWRPDQLTSRKMEAPVRRAENMILDPRHCGGKLLLYDQGCLHVKNSGQKLLDVFHQSTDCHECSLLRLFSVNPGQIKHAVVQTTSQTLLEFNNGQKFKEYFQFGQHGHYNVSVNETCQSDIFCDVAPDDAFFPLKIELWILFIIVTLCIIGACTSYYLTTFQWLFQTNFAHRELLNDFGTPSESPVDPGSFTSGLPVNPTQTARSARVQFIDAFRGLAMVSMVFVNYGGGKYWIFEHAPWNGLTFADIVFPSFAFVMGMSLLLSISSLYRITNSKIKVSLKVVLRSLVMISLGIILNSFNHPNLLTMRLPGVLQRLGLAYLIVGLIEVLFLQIHFSPLDTDRLRSLHDCVSWCGLIKWVIISCLVIVHTNLLFFMKVPGCPIGYIGPGGLHMNSSAENCTGGASRYIDSLIFTPEHLYNHTGSLNKLYKTNVTFDPEGLLGVLTTSLTVFLGVCAVRLYLISRSPRKLILKWISLSILCGLSAGLLCNWSTDNGIIPVNKRLWSLSYTLLTASIALLTISILYFLIDYKKFWNGSPFNDVGKNAILIYIGHEVLKKTFPWVVAPIDMTDHTEILLMNTWSTCLWILIAVMLAKNNIIIAI